MPGRLLPALPAPAPGSLLPALPAPASGCLLPALPAPAPGCRNFLQKLFFQQFFPAPGLRSVKPSVRQKPWQGSQKKPGTKPAG
ncbi:MAG: hypothetical protein E7239_07240 [Sarcina sp.]|nr:hypothetical protein [Sarcina sp.]